LPASLPRTRTLLTTRRRWRNRVSVRRRASGRVHYNYFRDYDSAVGRYVESDPIGLLGGNNTYRYAHANPTNYIDPLGLNTRALTRVLPWAGGAAAADGPAPIGDVIAILGIAGAILYDACTDDYEEVCNDRFEREVDNCKRFLGRGPKEDPNRWYRACKIRAADRRNRCYTNRGPSDDEPGEYGDDEIP